MKDRLAELMDKILTNARLEESEPRASELATRVKEFIDWMLPHYERHLGIPQVAILEALEKRRDYWAPSFYQKAKFPDLTGVRVFETQDELRAAIPSMKFRCPRCEGESTSPYECNTGLPMEKGKTCDWKAYGLFGTMGLGFRFTVKNMFLENPIVDEIFMPLELEPKEKAA